MINYSKMEQQLNGEYKETFSRIYSDIMTRNYQTDFLDDKMSELFDLLMTAQTQQTPVTRFVGNDTQKFCREFFSDYGLKERMRAVADRLKTIAWLLAVFEMLGSFADTGSFREFFSQKTNIAPYGIGLGTAFVISLLFAFFRPVIWKSKKASTGKVSGIYCLMMFIIFAIGFTLFKDKKLMFPVAPIILGSAAYLIIYYTVRSVCNYRRFGSVRDPQRALYRESEKALNDAGMDNMILKIWAKRYEKLLKKGKVTEETYLERLKKDEKTNDRGEIIYTVIVLILIAAAIVQVALTSPLFDTLGFAAIVLTISGLIWRFFHKCYLRGKAARSSMIAEMEEQGKTAPRYIAEKLLLAAELS